MRWLKEPLPTFRAERLGLSTACDAPPGRPRVVLVCPCPPNFSDGVGPGLWRELIHDVGRPTIRRGLGSLPVVRYGNLCRGRPYPPQSTRDAWRELDARMGSGEAGLLAVTGGVMHDPLGPGVWRATFRGPDPWWDLLFMYEALGVAVVMDHFRDREVGVQASPEELLAWVEGCISGQFPGEA